MAGPARARSTMNRISSTASLGPGLRFFVALGIALCATQALYIASRIRPEASYALVFGAVLLAAFFSGRLALLTLGLCLVTVAGLRLWPFEAPLSLGRADLLRLALHALPAWLALEILADRTRGEARSRPVSASGPLARPDQDLLSHLGAVTWDADWTQSLELEQEKLRVRRVSQRVQELSGYPPTRWIAEPDFHFSLIHPDDLAGFRDFCSRTADGEPTGAVEYRLMRADGGTVWVRHLMTASPSGRPDTVVLRGLLVDISDQKEVEETLRASEAWYRRIVHTASEGLLVLNADLECVYVNPRMAAMLGLRPERMLERTAVDFLAEEDRARAEVFLRNLKPEHSDQRDFRLRKADGSVCWVMVSASAIRGERCGVVGSLLMVTDITARYQAEEALREAARAKDQFLAMLAHELRNPLAAVRNALEVMRMAPDGSPARERALDTVERQVVHQVRMVDDLLDVSRINRGKVELVSTELDFVELVRNALRDHQAAFESAGVSLRVALREGPLTVAGDATRLSQVVTNLLQNALKFTDAGGEVQVSLAPRDGEAVLSVSDNGMGIEAGMLRRIFDSFTQADQSLARTRGGLGLGLALVRGLVELHGGSVEAQSEGSQRGAQFTVRLPLQKAGSTEMQYGQPEPRRAAGGRRVLVVEDLQDAAETLRDLLELAGHEVVVASDGRAGVEAAWEHHPDVVLCDIGLPELDGYEVVRRVRAAQNGHRPFMVAVTGYGQPSDRARALEAGFDEHVTKPVAPEHLLRLIEG